MNAPIEQASMQPDYAAIKSRQQQVWASGDFSVIGTTLQIVGEQLAESVDLRAGERVLDVAAGNGNATLAAARRFAQVTATDFVPALLEKAAARAQAEGAQVVFQTADAENLPFADGHFDVVLSTFGVMFAPQQERAASELLRVLRPGGRVGLANWTPEGFIGQLFRTVGRVVAPVAGLRSPALWGNEAHLASLFDPSRVVIQTQRRHFNFRYRSAAHWIAMFRDYYGPTHKAFASLDGPGQATLTADLEDLLARYNQGGAHSLVVPAEYLEVVITKA